MGDWCTIESDPGVFTEMIHKFGVTNVQMAEVIDMDDLKNFSPTYGLVFLFKYKEEKDPRPVTPSAPGVFFAQQVISNACATQAIINILLNRPDVALGAELEQYRDFASALPSDVRGLTLGQMDSIRNIHNSFNRPEPFVMESRAATKDDDVFHFIAYVPVGGQVWELDGLKAGPILLGDCTNDNWTDVAKTALRERIERYAKSEVHFALMALIENQKLVAERDLASAEVTQQRIQKLLAGEADDAMQTDDQEALPSDPAELKTQLAQVQARTVELKATIEREEARFQGWKEENIRRRHNYVPFMFNLLKVLAKKDKLDGLIEEGRKVSEQRAKAAASSAKR